MSSFAALFDRAGRPISREDKERLGEAVIASGRTLSDGTLDDSANRSLALLAEGPGGWRGQPEKEGANFAGLDEHRLADLRRSLGESSPDGAQAPFHAPGRPGFARESAPEGSFAALWFDSSSRILRLARGPLGERSLYYFERGGVVVVSDRLDLLLGWPGKRWRLSATQLAGYFAIDGPSAGATYFEGIAEVERGVVVEISSGRIARRRFWRPEAIEPLRLESDARYAEAFASHLERATASRMPADGQGVGVMLSGGLDSSAIASSAARVAAKRGRRVAACSWGFTELAECDEQGWQDLVIAACDLDPIRMSGDELWPFRDLDGISALPDAPEDNPYRLLKTALYRRAAESGCRHLLNGGPADVLHRGGSLYLRDLVRAGWWRIAALDWWKQLRQSGPRAALGAVSRLVLPEGRSHRSRLGPPWLTSEGQALLGNRSEEHSPSRGLRRDALAYLGTQARSQMLESEYARALGGVEVGSPYWTLEFVEFMLSLPAHQVFRPGTDKYVSRQAARGRLPEAVRLRRSSSGLEALFDRGIFERERSTVRALLDDGRRVWDRFVDPERVTNVTPDSSPVEKLLVWRCASFEHWRQRHGWEVD